VPCGKAPQPPASPRRDHPCRAGTDRAAWCGAVDGRRGVPRSSRGARRFQVNTYQRERATAAQRKTKVYKATRTIRIDACVKPELGQPLRWGSPEWIKAFGRRNAVESGYSNIKSPDGEGVKRGWIHLVGLVATRLMLAFAIAHYNLRMIRKWAELNERTDEHELFELEPEILGYEPVSIEAGLRMPEANAPQTLAA
jgi:hypothetical protein